MLLFVASETEFYAKSFGASNFVAGISGGMMGGFRCRLVSVESSSPLNASRRRRPSASTSSIWCLMSCTDSTVSSSGISLMPMWVYVDSIPLDEPGKEEGGAVRLPDRVLVRDAASDGGPGSVAENV